MPQGPLPTLDISEGTRSLLNVTAPVVVKASPGRFARVVVSTEGTVGSLVVNDCTTLAAASVANQVVSVPWNALNEYAGSSVGFLFPCATGITISAVPTGSVLAVSYT